MIYQQCNETYQTGELKNLPGYLSALFVKHKLSASFTVSNKQIATQKLL